MVNESELESKLEKARAAILFVMDDCLGLEMMVAKGGDGPSSCADCRTGKSCFLHQTYLETAP